MGSWLYFAFVQLSSLVAMVIGWFILIIPCALGAWKPVDRVYCPMWMEQQGLPKGTIYIWKLNWMNAVWGNDEDGVTGPLWYNDPISKWRAYLWSAWRNSANNLRFVFRNFNGPFYRKQIGNWYFQAGWYPNGFPVLSAGRV